MATFQPRKSAIPPFRSLGFGRQRFLSAAASDGDGVNTRADCRQSCYGMPRAKPTWSQFTAVNGVNLPACLAGGRNNIFSTVHLFNTHL